MEPVTRFKYRAFLSYSHRDKAAGEWLHRSLENYRIDKDLVGRATPAGAVPKSLRPIFRDREDFSAGASLTTQTMAALEASQFLIVACSPNAAKSPYVNEEIRRFKALGRADYIVPIVTDGEPGHPERECFPPALRFKVGADGALTSEREEPIAADAREQGDGKEIAKHKVVAGLLGVGLDEMFRRAERARRRRNRLWVSLAGVFLLLAITSAGSAVVAYQKFLESEERLDQAVELAFGFVLEAISAFERSGVPTALPLALLNRAEEGLGGLIERGADTPKLRHRRALMLLAFSEGYRALGRTEERRRSLQMAMGILTELLQRGPNPDWQRDLVTAHLGTGDLVGEEGDVEGALASYRRGLAIAEQLVASSPDEMKWQHALADAHEKVGDALGAQGHDDAALKSFHTARMIRESLAAREPKYSQWQRALSLIQNKIGDVLAAQRNFADAMKYYRASLAIREALLVADKENTGLQHNIATGYIRIGDLQYSQGEIDAALKSLGNARAILVRLTQADSSNIRWLRALAATYERIAAILTARQQAADAIAQLRAGMEAHRRIVATDPGNPRWQWEMIETQWRLILLDDEPVTRLNEILGLMRKLRGRSAFTTEQDALHVKAQALENMLQGQ